MSNSKFETVISCVINILIFFLKNDIDNVDLQMCNSTLIRDQFFRETKFFFRGMQAKVPKCTCPAWVRDLEQKKKGGFEFQDPDGNVLGSLHPLFSAADDYVQAMANFGTEKETVVPSGVTEADVQALLSWKRHRHLTNDIFHPSVNLDTLIILCGLYMEFELPKLIEEQVAGHISEEPFSAGVEGDASVVENGSKKRRRSDGGDVCCDCNGPCLGPGDCDKAPVRKRQGCRVM